MKKCRKCREMFEPTPNQIKKNDFLCRDCDRAYRAAWREKRKAEGLPTSGSKMPAEYHKAYQEEYLKNPAVKQRRAAYARQRRNDPKQALKITARDLLNKAVNAGRIEKQPCEICGELKVDAQPDD